MLLEAAVEDEAALLPPQYQTNYREEYQYSGPPTGQYVSQHPVPALREVYSAVGCRIAQRTSKNSIQSIVKHCRSTDVG